MEKQIQLLLPEYIVNKLQRAAKLKAMDIPRLLDEVVDRYLEEKVLSQIEKEQQSYEAQHDQLLEQYKGEYIAMQNGQVIDHDSDRVALSHRVRARYGNAPMLITPVLAQARQTIVVRSPRLREKTL